MPISLPDIDTIYYPWEDVGSTALEVRDAASALGSWTFGGYVLGAPVADFLIEQSGPITDDDEIVFNGCWGVSFWNFQKWNWPTQLDVFQSFSSSSNGLTITFYTKTYSVLGRIWTDADTHIVLSLEFQLDRNGCGDGKLSLSKLPDFPIIPFGLVGIQFGSSNGDIYLGFINVNDQIGSTKDTFDFTISGLREQLTRNKVNRVIEVTGGFQDVATVVESIVDNEIVGSTNIRKVSGLLPNETGVLVGALDFSKEPVKQCMENLSIMTDNEYDWGVDASGSFFFLEKSDTIVKVFVVGYGKLLKFQPKLEIDEIKNSIIIQRSLSTGPGWSTPPGGIQNDDSSIAKYGLRELFYKVPGFFADATCQIVAEALLRDKKEPKFSAKSEHHIEDETDLIPRGTYRFISAEARFSETIVECDDTNGWSKSGAGDLAISFVSSPLQSGAGSIRLHYTNATGDFAIVQFEQKRRPDSIILFIRSPLVGSYIRIGAGELSAEIEKDIPINSSNLFIPTIVDVSSLTTIGYISFEILSSGQENSVYIDAIGLYRVTNKYYDLEMKRVNYRFGRGGATASAEWGEPAKDFADYVTGLLALAESNKYATEDR